jgi:hypothetical protein
LDPTESPPLSRKRRQERTAGEGKREGETESSEIKG